MNINTAEYWNKVYESEEDWRVYPKTFEFILDEIQSGSEVVEIGCGTGILGEMIHKKAYYVGYDISKIAVQKAQSKGVNAFVLDASKEEIQNGDLLIAAEFLEHFTDEELAVILPRFRDAAPKAIYAVPNDCLGHKACEEHYQKWNKETFRKFLSNYYYDVIILDYKDKIPSLNAELDTLFAICRRQSK